jgi:nicotinamide-nucleotide adenylyltransferase
MTVKDRSKDMQFSNAGMVARWQPVHLGHAAVLEGLCQSAERVKIGVGSANAQDVRSPFTLAEVEDMLRLTLDGYHNYALVPLPDLHDGPRWREMVAQKFGSLEIFFTDNPYVASLMGEVYSVARPVGLVPEDRRVPVTGTMVRLAMARGEEWQTMLPESVADYLIENQLDQRFRREFGLETLAAETIIVEKEK